MCDNLVVLPSYTTNSRMIFAKNSDRPANESQPFVYNQRKTYQDGQELKLAYVTIKQAEETFMTIGSSPYWCWGYEQGMNEYGVAIGNEAIFTKDLKDSNKNKGILGMELVRIGLERAKTAEEAMRVISHLIEEYGQWGSAVVGEEKPYNNSFIIADAQEAWVLETMDRNWVAKKVTDKFHAISNEMSIRDQWDFHSEDFMEKLEVLDAALACTDFTNSMQVSHIRVQRTKQLLKDHGKMDVAGVKRILRDHYEDTFLNGPFFNAALPDFQTICMHSSPANFTWGITASSTIFELPKEEGDFPVVWWSPATPCTGLYLPIFMCEQEFPELFANAGTVRTKSINPMNSPLDESAENSYWWIFRDLLTEIKGDEIGTLFNENQMVVRKHFDQLEEKWSEEIRFIEEKAANLGNRKEAERLLASFTQNCIKEAVIAIAAIKKCLLKESVSC